MKAKPPKLDSDEVADAFVTTSDLTDDGRAGRETSLSCRKPNSEDGRKRPFCSVIPASAKRLRQSIQEAAAGLTRERALACPKASR